MRAAGLLAVILLAPLARADTVWVASGTAVDACGSPVAIVVQATGGPLWTLRVTVVADAKSDFNCGGLALRQDVFLGTWGASGACFAGNGDVLCLDGPAPGSGERTVSWPVTFRMGESYIATGHLSGASSTQP